jgi:hypothetical protein
LTQIERISTFSNASIHVRCNKLGAIVRILFCYEELGILGRGGDGGGGDGGGAGIDGKGCSLSDTSASCAARQDQDGYAMRDASGYGVQGAAALSGSQAAQQLAAQVGPACRVGVDNMVDAEYRTEMYEQQTNQNSSPAYVYEGSN